MKKPTVWADPPITRTERIDLLTCKEFPTMVDIAAATEILDHIESKGFTLYRLRKADAKPRAEPTSRRMTKELAVEIKAYYAAHPSMSCKAIGRVFQVDGGRVSETINGKWD